MVFVYYINTEGKLASTECPYFGIKYTVKDVVKMLRSVGCTMTGAGYEPIGEYLG